MVDIVNFNIDISADLYEQYYAGTAKKVVVRADDGRLIEFPVQRLQPFLTHTGVQGRFAISFDENNKFISIEKLD